MIAGKVLRHGFNLGTFVEKLTLRQRRASYNGLHVIFLYLRAGTDLAQPIKELCKESNQYKAWD
jgi:hypothetical protein